MVLKTFKKKHIYINDYFTIHVIFKQWFNFMTITVDMLLSKHIVITFNNYYTKSNFISQGK